MHGLFLQKRNTKNMLKKVSDTSFLETSPDKSPNSNEKETKIDFQS